MWTLILEVALKLLGFSIDRFQDNKAMKEAFLKFVETYDATKSGASVKLHDNYEEEKKELLNKPPGDTL